MITASQGQIAEIKIGDTQQIWRMLGPSLYSMRPLFPITIREMFQNSVDAQKAKGVENPVDFRIVQDKDGNLTVTCEDAGVGMTEDIILNKFLAIGGSEKGSDKATGGFGIAKASIIGACAGWSLYTKKSYLDSGMIGKCPVAQVSEEVDGCKIVLNYNFNEENLGLKFTYGMLDNAMAYLATSQYPARVYIEKNGKSSSTDLHGYAPNEKMHIATISNNAYKAKLYLAPQIKYSYFSAYFCDLQWDGYNNNVSLEGKIIYRLNGLTQFITWGGDCKFNVLVDIESYVKPTDSEYPFSASRETAKADLRNLVEEKTKNFFKNPVTTQQLIGNIENNVAEQKVQYYDGELVQTAIFTSAALQVADDAPVAATIAKTDVEVTIDEIEEQVATLPELDATFVIRKKMPEKLVAENTGFGRTAVQFSNEETTISPVAWKMCIKYRDASVLKKLVQKKYAKILRVWTELMQKLMEANPAIAHSFAIGFITNEHRFAERFDDYKNNTVYYLIDPTTIKISGGLDTVLQMLQYAAHELAHSKFYSHDENFTCEYHRVWDNFMQKFGTKTLRQIAKVFKAK
jgi:hypothetical protein